MFYDSRRRMLASIYLRGFHLSRFGVSCSSILKQRPQPITGCCLSVGLPRHPDFFPLALQSLGKWARKAQIDDPAAPKPAPAPKLSPLPAAPPLPTAAAPGPEPTILLNQMSLGSEEALSAPASEIPSVSHLLIATENYLRLYPVDGLRAGDRSTIRKTKLEHPLGFAAPFRSSQGPGLAAITKSGILLVSEEVLSVIFNHVGEGLWNRAWGRNAPVSLKPVTDQTSLEAV